MIYTFVGFETIAVTAGETHQPRRTLPKVLVATVITTGLLYFLIVLVFVSVIDPADYAEATLVDVGRSLAGTAGAFAITLAAVFSIGGNLAGSMLAAPRLVFSLAESRQLPKWFAHVHERYATPDRCIMVMGALALLHHVGTKQGWLWRNCLRTASIRADTSLPARRSALPCSHWSTLPAGQITPRPCPQGIRGLSQVRPSGTRFPEGALRQLPL
jgi:amino acid permease